jgi:hypothetical protein
MGWGAVVRAAGRSTGSRAAGGSRCERIAGVSIGMGRDETAPPDRRPANECDGGRELMVKIWAAVAAVAVELVALAWVAGSHAVEWMTSGLAALGQ